MWTKFKSFIVQDSVFTALLVVLVGVISFGLGRQSVSNRQNNVANQPAGVSYTEAYTPRYSTTSATIQPILPSTTNPTSAEGKVVASKSGSKYHLLTCPGANQIKEENKVYFDTPALAEAGGFQSAANCPGLQK